MFYAVDKAGYLTRRASTHGRPVPHRARSAPATTQIAVSPYGKYLAALRDSALYTAPIGDPLVKRGSGYLAISWDNSDQPVGVDSRPRSSCSAVRRTRGSRSGSRSP